MTAEIQELLLRVDASTELARRELKKMEEGFDGFVRRSEQSVGAAESNFARLNSAATLVKGSIAGFVAGIGIEGVISFGRAILDTADSLDAAAEKAGIGVERYQTLRESLRSLEVDGDKVDAIFGRLTDTLGAVQGGTAGEGVVAVLDKMGITSRILNGEIDTTDELLDAIAGSAKSFGSQAEFTAAVIDLVGRKLGVDLANAIKDGGAALKAGEQSWKDAGGVVDAEYIKKLADANEAVDRFTSNTKSKLLIWSAQVLETFATVGDGITGVQDVLKKEGRLAAVASLFDGGTNARGRNIRVRREILATPFDPSANGLSGFDRPLVVPDSGSGRVPDKASGSAASRVTPAEVSQAQLREGGFDIRQDLMAKLPIALTQMDALTGKFTELQIKAVDLSNVDVIDVEGLRVGVGLLEDASFSLTNALIGAGNLGDALVDTFARAGASMLQSGILNLFSGGTQGTSFGTLFKGIGSLFGGARADGGPVIGGVPYLVGERGPEIVVPGMSGSVIPNHALRTATGRGGGSTTVQNFDLRGALVTEDVMATINARAMQAAQAGAMGGKALAAQDSARRARRRLG